MLRSGEVRKSELAACSLVEVGASRFVSKMGILGEISEQSNTFNNL